MGKTVLKMRARQNVISRASTGHLSLTITTFNSEETSACPHYTLSLSTIERPGQPDAGSVREPIPDRIGLQMKESHVDWDKKHSGKENGLGRLAYELSSK